MSLFGHGCSDEPLSDEEQAWADQVALEVSRINDVLTIELMPAQTPDIDGDGEPDYEADGTPSLKWAEIAEACRLLVSPEERRGPPAQNVPPAFDALAERLHRYQLAISEFGEQCLRGADQRDYEGYQAAGPLLDEAGEAAEHVVDELPDGARCPDDVEDRPESCDALF